MRRAPAGTFRWYLDAEFQFQYAPGCGRGFLGVQREVFVSRDLREEQRVCTPAVLGDEDGSSSVPLNLLSPPLVRPVFPTEELCGRI